MSSITDPTPLHDQDHATHHHGDGEHSPHGLGHISPWQTLVKVWAALMVLTILTVMATWVNLGSLNIWIAMAIAVIKGALVVLYFMHMKYDRPFIAYIFTFSLAFVAFFLAMVMLDSKNYQRTIEIRRLDEIQVKTPPAPPAATAPAPAK